MQKEDVHRKFIEYYERDAGNGLTSTGGYGGGGWHYQVKENPHLGKTVNVNKEYRYNTDKAGAGDNDGLLEINGATFEGAFKSNHYSYWEPKDIKTKVRIATDVENSVKISATHDGFIQMYLRNGGDEKRLIFMRYLEIKVEIQSHKKLKLEKIRLNLYFQIQENIILITV